MKYKESFCEVIDNPDWYQFDRLRYFQASGVFYRNLIARNDSATVSFVNSRLAYVQAKTRKIKKGYHDEKHLYSGEVVPRIMHKVWLTSRTSPFQIESKLLVSFQTFLLEHPYYTFYLWVLDPDAMETIEIGQKKEKRKGDSSRKRGGKKGEIV